MLCSVCGRPLSLPARTNRVYCSTACRQRAFRRRNAEHEAASDSPRRPSKRALVAQIQKARWSKGLPPLLQNPHFDREAEIRALKKLLQGLEAAHQKEISGGQWLLREITPEDALTQPSAEVVYLGVGRARTARRDVEQLVLLVGKDAPKQSAR